MTHCEFEDRELDVLNHAVKLLQRDLNFDFVTATRNNNLEWSRDIIDSLIDIEFILPKIKI